MANIPTSTKLQWCTFISFWGLPVILRISPLTISFTPNQKYTHNCNRLQECLPFQRVSEDSCQRSKDCAKGCVHVGDLCAVYALCWIRNAVSMAAKKKNRVPFDCANLSCTITIIILSFILNWNIKDYRKKNNTGGLLKWTIFHKRHSFPVV